MYVVIERDMDNGFIRDIISCVTNVGEYRYSVLTG